MFTLYIRKLTVGVRIKDTSSQVLRLLWGSQREFAGTVKYILLLLRWVAINLPCIILVLQCCVILSMYGCANKKTSTSTSAGSHAVTNSAPRFGKTWKMNKGQGQGKKEKRTTNQNKTCLFNWIRTPSTTHVYLNLHDSTLL